MISQVVNDVQQFWRQSTTARNITKVYGGNIVSTAINVGTALILIRGLSVSDYASFVAFNSLAALSAGLVGNAINIALVRFAAEQLSRTGKKPYSLYIAALIVEVAIFLVLIVVCFASPAGISKLVLGKDTFARAVQVGMIYGLGLLLLQMGRGVYQAEQRFNLYIGTLWLRQGLTLILLAGFWLTNRLTFESVAWLSASLSLVVGAGVIFYSLGIQKSKITIGQIWGERSQLRQFFSATGWLVGYYLCLSAFGQMDIIMLSRYTNETEVAIYGVAFRYFTMALLLLEAINAVLLPKFSQPNMQNSQAQRSFLKNWLRFSVWAIIPVFLFVIFGRKPFIWLNGPNYANSFYILVIFAFGTWLSLMLSPLTNILISRRDFRFMFFLGACALLTSIIGSLILIPLWHGIGAAIVVVIANNFVLQLPILWRVYKG
jgi:O-antigen/teichoic acid export membrane protein